MTFWAVAHFDAA